MLCEKYPDICLEAEQNSNDSACFCELHQTQLTTKEPIYENIYVCVYIYIYIYIYTYMNARISFKRAMALTAFHVIH